MICDVCNERESVISYTKFDGENVEEVHLCEKCAEEKLKSDFSRYMNIGINLDDFLKNIFQFASQITQDNEDYFCENCGMSFSEYRQSGIVGCSNCYDTFRNEIKNYFKSINKVPKHIGNIPQNANKNLKNKREISQLESELEILISLEEYENAAIVRDKIKLLKEESYEDSNG